MQIKKYWGAAVRALRKRDYSQYEIVKRYPALTLMALVGHASLSYVEGRFWEDFWVDTGVAIATASTAGSEDYVSIDEMVRESSGAEGTADRVAIFARRIGDDLAGRIGAELVKRGAAETAKTAGLGVAEIGAAGILGLCALGATGTAMIVGLNKVIPMWASSLVAAGAFGIPAGILAARGSRHVKAMAAIGSPAQP